MTAEEYIPITDDAPPQRRSRRFGLRISNWVIHVACLVVAVLLCWFLLQQFIHHTSNVGTSATTNTTTPVGAPPTAAVPDIAPKTPTVAGAPPKTTTALSSEIPNKAAVTGEMPNLSHGSTGMKMRRTGKNAQSLRAARLLPKSQEKRASLKGSGKKKTSSRTKFSGSDNHI